MNVLCYSYTSQLHRVAGVYCNGTLSIVFAQESTKSCFDNSNKKMLKCLNEQPKSLHFFFLVDEQTVGRPAASGYRPNLAILRSVKICWHNCLGQMIFSLPIFSLKGKIVAHKKYICHSHDITLTSNDDKVYLKFENPDFFFILSWTFSTTIPFFCDSICGLAHNNIYCFLETHEIKLH